MPSKRSAKSVKLTQPRMFRISIEIERANEELKTVDPRRKRCLMRHIRRLEAMITPAKKRKAADDRRPMVAKCRETLQASGPPKNIASFITEQHDGAFMAKRKGQPVNVSMTTKRKVAHTVLGTKGGRPRKSRPQK
jgi:hypothetical protein